MYNEFTRLLLELSSPNKPETGLTGGEDSDGNYAIQVEDDPNSIYVRTIEGDVQSAPYDAVNIGVPLQPDYPVIIYVIDKVAYATPDPVRSKDYRGANESISTVGPHSHEPDSGNFDVVSTRRMREGQIVVTIPYSMSVTCTPLKYFDADSNEQMFYSDTLDLTSFVPSDANTHRYVKVYLNIITGRLGAEAGDAKAVTMQLTEEDIIAIVLGEESLPLACVRLFNGMTVIDDDRLIVDWRHWINNNSVGSSAIDRILTDENGDVLSDENGDVLTED